MQYLQDQDLEFTKLQEETTTSFPFETEATTFIDDTTITIMEDYTTTKSDAKEFTVENDTNEESTLNDTSSTYYNTESDSVIHSQTRQPKNTFQRDIDDFKLLYRARPFSTNGYMTTTVSHHRPSVS